MSDDKGGTMDKLIWIDLETTGLDPAYDTILEVACVITDMDLNELGSHEVIVTSIGAAAFANRCLDTGVVYEMHASSGLVDAINADRQQKSITPGLALKDIAEHIKELHASGSVLAGSNVAFDRAFIREAAPTVEQMLHYGNLDVSSVRRFMEITHPDMAPFEKKKAHRAMADIRESIEELKYYRGIVGDAK